MQLFASFQTHIKANQLFQLHDLLLIAVSGGVDSVVLAHLCKKAGHQIRLLHCNFQLRGAESDRDEALAHKLAADLDCSIDVKQFNTKAWAEENKCSIQEAARELRYTWFDQLQQTEQHLLKQTNPNANVYVLTAHHADDNAETLLMHFFRGTGLRGLKGIPEKQGNIRRPLLHFSRADIEHYAQMEQLEFVQDSSNADEKYTRNYVRHSLVPAIEKVYPQLRENMADNIRRFQSIDALYHIGVQNIIRKLCKQKEDALHIPIRGVLQYNNDALMYEIIQPFGFTEKQIPEFVKLAQAESGSGILSPRGDFRIIKHRQWLIISPVASPIALQHVWEEEDKKCVFAGGSITQEFVQADKIEISKDANMALLDARNIKFPLLLRKWRAGDYFYPLGMKKKKKLSRFFIDVKLSAIEKEKIWVLESAERIVWVVGMRIDERFKITNHTQKAIRFVLHAEKS